MNIERLDHDLIARALWEPHPQEQTQLATDINKVNAGIGAFFVGLFALGIAAIVSNKKKIWQFK